MTKIKPKFCCCKKRIPKAIVNINHVQKFFFTFTSYSFSLTVLSKFHNIYMIKYLFKQSFSIQRKKIKYKLQWHGYYDVYFRKCVKEKEVLVIKQLNLKSQEVLDQFKYFKNKFYSSFFFSKKTSNTWKIENLFNRI